MNVLNTTLQNALEQIQGVHPLLHCISNIVTANDCANLALAIGASPIMAQEPQEMSQIAALAKAVILNTGTPDEAKFQAAAIAGKTANQLHIPVILDPVGIGASTWRLNHIHDLLSQVSSRHSPGQLRRSQSPFRTDRYGTWRRQPGKLQEHRNGFLCQRTG